MVISRHDADRRRHRAASPVAAMTSPVLSTISRGSSGLPVACAGQTDVQRPHIVQASVSSSCFQVKSSTVEAPNVSSSVSIRFGIGLHGALGAVAVAQVHVQRRREHVAQHRDRQDHEEDEERDHVRRPTRPGASRRGGRRSDEPRQRVADERPLLERRAGRSTAMRQRLGEEAGDAEQRRTCRGSARARAWS